MTIICWDGTTLAADRRITNGPTIGAAKKLFVLKETKQIAGIAGEYAAGLELIDWLRKGAKSSTFPPSCRDHDDGAFALVIGDTGEALLYTTGPLPMHIEAQHAAIGSGDEGGLIAMHCGQDAISAVCIVSQFNKTCGNGYDALTLEALE